MKKLHKNCQVCNHMQVAVILTMLCALVHASTAEGVPVDIKLENGTVLSGHTLDTVDFGCMEGLDWLEQQQSEQDRKPPEIQLGMISDEGMLTRLKKCWDSDMTDSDEDMDADTFYRFVEAADYLLLQGDKYKQFARNMVRKGVLGKHSMAIVRQRLGTGHMGYTSLFWSMLIALASECGCEVRVMKRDGHKTEVTLCSVDDGEAESYGVPGSVFETSPVIDRLSVRCNILSDRVDRMEILTWLTDYLEVTLLWIGSELRMTKKDTQSIVKWRSETRLGLSLDLSGYYHTSHSFVKAIVRRCLSLITSRYKQPIHSFVKNLIPTIPALEELHIQGVTFKPSAAHIFGQCVGLEKLCIGGYSQKSAFVSALMPNLTSIRELVIDVEKLSTDAAMAFGQCKRLEKLYLVGSVQSSSFVSTLMPNLPNIRELKICAGELSPDVAAAFRQCKKFEKLYLIGSWQTSSFVSALMPNLPNIRELWIYLGDLSPEAAVALRQCKQLEKLHLGGSWQTSSFASTLMPNLPSIRELWIYVEKLSPDAATTFGECKELKKLFLVGFCQDSSFISALMPNLLNIRELAIYVEKLSTDAAATFGECKRLEKLCLGGSSQTSSSVSTLMPNLANIRELTISVNELSSDAAETFRQCKRLEKLYLDGFLEPGCIECILSSPYMESLRYLHVGRVMGGVSDGDKKAISEARKRHIVVNVH